MKDVQQKMVLMLMDLQVEMDVGNISELLVYVVGFLRGHLLAFHYLTLVSVAC